MGRVYTQYAPQAQQAQSDEAYWRVVAQMLAELNDGHTGLLSPSAQSGRRYFATCRALDGAIVVDAIGATAQAAGLERGDEVQAVDGRPINEALEALPPTLIAGSTPQRRRAKAAFNILSTTGDTLGVTVNGPAGERALTLSWPEAPAAPQAQTPAPWQPLITGERRPSGLGLIRIPDFGSGNHDLVAEFDAALDARMDAPGLILDLRGNGGGSGNPVRFALPGGGQARFSTGAFRRNDGSLITEVASPQSAASPYRGCGRECRTERPDPPPAQ